MLRGAGLTGAADSSQGIFSLWFKLNGGNGVTQAVLRNTTAHVNIFRQSTNLLGFVMQNAAGTITFQTASVATYIADGKWHHWICTWDTNFAAGSKVIQQFVDDVSDVTVVADAGVAFPVDTTDTNWAIGATTASALKANMDMAEFYYAIGTTIDLSVVANRRKWFVNGGAANLGSDGSAPTGIQPIIYQRGPAAAFPTNLGSGGDWTVTGTLTDAPIAPPCGLVAVAPSGSGGRPRYRRPPEPVRIPQQVVDDVEALYRSIYAGRKNLDPVTLRAVADLVGFFAESFDGRLPPAEAVHWRDLVEYPSIDLSILRTAADLLIALPVQAPPKLEGPAATPKWAAIEQQAGAVDRAMERLKRDAQAAAERAATAEREDEEDALLALLMVL